MNKPLFLGIDFGTSGCRAIVIDDAATICAEARVELSASMVIGNRVSQDPRVWETGLRSLFDQLRGQIMLKNIVALCIDGTSGSVLLCDATGTPLTPALMYNDADNADAAERIRTLAPDQSGAHGRSSGLAKLISLQTMTDSPNAIALNQADWLSGVCRGDFLISDENNALKMGYDPVARNWPQWIGELLDLEKIQLPVVLTPGSFTGRVCAEFAQRSGLSTTTAVIAGTTDSIAAFLATGVDNVGDAVTTLGSTLVLKILCEEPVFAPEFGVYSHRLGAYWLAGGASNAGCAVFKQFFTQKQIDDMSAQLNPQQSTGLDYYPLLRKGERFPIADPDLAPQLEPRPSSDVSFFQGMLEGLATIEQQAYEKLHEMGAPYPRRVLTSGGGSVNDAWTQIRQTKLRTTVERAQQTEAAYGSALLAHAAIQQQE
ncbi:MAG: FGGY-family carbohydrate kinase [Gammaproteobacteria bacterium]|nr:FGGY-family carbohydrate kinase [Gammaproteobacteria bacterium]